MKARPGFAFLLTAWLLSLAVPAAVISLLLGVPTPLVFTVIALLAAALTLAAGTTRFGGARFAVLVPGLAGSALVLYGAVTGAQDSAAVVYYIAAVAWLVALVAALITKGGDAG